MMRLYVSRPNWSVPSQGSALGGASRLRRFWTLGSCVATSGAKTAARTISARAITPNRVRGLRQKRRTAFDRRRGSVLAAAASAITQPQPGVHVGVEDIYDQVDYRVSKVAHQNDSLYHRKILGADRVHCESAESRP